MLLPGSAFFLASIAITLAPGPDILYVLATGISRGRQIAIVAAAGFASGLSVHTACAAFGLSALLIASPMAFTAVKAAGACYLGYLGIRSLGSRGIPALAERSNTAPPRQIYRQAFLMNVLNPKVALFFLAFLPQFAAPERGPLAHQFVVMGGCLAIIAFSIFSLVGIFSSAIGPSLKAHPRVSVWFDCLVGILFLLIAFRLLFASAH